jgi:ribonuclease HII
VLSPEKRYALYLHIMFYARAVALGWIDHAEIDDIGLGEANRRAMLLAVSRLSPPADALIVDHVRLPELAIEQRRFPRAENVSLSVAAASIVAKVSRDRWMEAWDQAYPPYNFARNKGYGTAAHRAALAVHGPCRLHRRSFRPVASFA